MTIFFSENDVGSLLKMDEAIVAVDHALCLLGKSDAVNRPRSRVRAGKLTLHTMPAGSLEIGYVGMKAYTTGPSGARFYFLQFDANDGRLVALMEADRLGQIRTGAATGVATRYMSRQESKKVGIYGTGWQARSQLEAIALVRPIESVVAYSPRLERRSIFCQEMSQLLSIPVTACDAPEEVTQSADIVVVATNSREPVLRGDWLLPGQHVNAIGSNNLKRIEVDKEVIARANFIATDSVEQAKIECGDLAAVVSDGGLSWDHVYELADVVAKKVLPRSSEEDITLFESQGLAIEDVAVARYVYEAGQKQDIGKKLDI